MVVVKLYENIGVNNYDVQFDSDPLLRLIGVADTGNVKGGGYDAIADLKFDIVINATAASL